MTIYWMGYLSVLSAAFAGCLLALGVAALLRLARAIAIASKDGNANEHRIDAHARRPAPAVEPLAPQSLFVKAPEDPAPREVINPNTILAGPPMVGQYSLRDYLIHYANDDQIWAKIVAEFYTLAAQDAEVFAVFQASARRHGMDVGDLVAQVQKHFLAMLIVLTHVGLTVRLRDSLQSSHAQSGISPSAYDKTVTVLVQVLTRYGAPQEAFPALVEIVGQLQPYIVAA